MTDDEIPVLPKPDELLALHGVTEELFRILREWFNVPAFVTIDLREIDSAVTELGDHVMIAAMAMRKLQALHLLSTPGVMTTTDVVVNIIGDLDRALIQAPNMHLKRAAESTDWDAELAGLGLDLDDVSAADPLARSDHPSLAGDELDSSEERDIVAEIFGGNEAGLVVDRDNRDDSDVDDVEIEIEVDVEDLDDELVQALLGLGLLDDAESDDDDADPTGSGDDDDFDEDGEWVVVEYESSDALDSQIDYFRDLHALLHEAVRGILEASQGEIRYFV